MQNLSNIAKLLGSNGGKKSAESRLGGKTKEQISELMRKIRLTKKNMNYTIKKRQFTALNETDKAKRDKLNEDTLTSEYSPNLKYQLVCLSTEFVFSTKKECFEKISQLGIPLEYFLIHKP
jgi:hypothetical protein